MARLKRTVSPRVAWGAILGIVVVVVLVFFYMSVWTPHAQRKARTQKFIEKLGVKTEEEAVRMFIPPHPSQIQEDVRRRLGRQ